MGWWVGKARVLCSRKLSVAAEVCTQWSLVLLGEMLLCCQSGTTNLPTYEERLEHETSRTSTLRVFDQI